MKNGDVARHLQPAANMRTLMDLAIDRAYAAGAGETSWHEVLSSATRAFNAQGAMLITPEVPADAGGLSVSFDAGGRSSIRAVSPEQQARALPANKAYSTSLADDRDSTIPTALFVLFRAESAMPLEAQERNDVQNFCTHLGRAVRMWFREKSSRSGAEVLAMSLQAGALIVDADSRIQWKNARAGECIAQGQIVVSQGRAIGLPGFSIDLPRLVREVSFRPDAAHLILSPEATLEVVSLPVQAEKASHGSALLLVRDRNSCKQAAVALAANFRLTSTEVDLAMALWKGVLIGEYASQRSVAMSTVRTQLKSLLGKLRARRQSDVVSIVGRLVPLVAPRMADSNYSDRDSGPRRIPSNG
jgi:hypothetical protein